MANSNIPVPTDLGFSRTAPEVGFFAFTPKQAGLDYEIRYGTEEQWHLLGEWTLDVPASATADVAPGQVVKFFVDFDPAQLFPTPNANTNPLRYMIVAIDPAIRAAKPEAWQEWASFVYPPPPGMAVTDPGNWGQGPALTYYWEDWPPPSPEPDPLPDPLPDPDPIPPIDEIPTNTVVLVRRVSLNLKEEGLGTWHLYKELD